MAHDPAPTALYRLFKHLSDGRFHSGEALAEQAGLTRAGIWKQVQALKSLGCEVQSLPGRGYRLPRPLALLDANLITEAASLPALPIQLLPEIHSTNRYLLEAALNHPTACVAELQTAGRGRRGRSWLAPPGGNICLSLAWPVRALAVGAGALPLAVGVWLAEALADSLGCATRADDPQGLGLKWPNDLYADGHKLGGILIELRGELDGNALLVIGVGLNYKLPPAGMKPDNAAVPAGDLACLCSTLPSRSALIGRLINALATALPGYLQTGFAPWQPRFAALDVLRDLPVRVGEPDEVGREGVARSVDADGALRLHTKAGLERVVVGDVSLRPGPLARTP